MSNDLHLPIEESSKNEDNDKEEHVQLSSLTHKVRTKKIMIHACTCMLAVHVSTVK